MGHAIISFPVFCCYDKQSLIVKTWNGKKSLIGFILFSWVPQCYGTGHKWCFVHGDKENRTSDSIYEYILSKLFIYELYMRKDFPTKKSCHLYHPIYRNLFDISTQKIFSALIKNANFSENAKMHKSKWKSSIKKNELFIKMCTVWYQVSIRNDEFECYLPWFFAVEVLRWKIDMVRREASLIVYHPASIYNCNKKFNFKSD